MSRSTRQSCASSGCCTRWGLMATARYVIHHISNNRVLSGMASYSVTSIIFIEPQVARIVSIKQPHPPV